MKIDNLSVSRTGTWNQCELLYKYKYHLKLLPSDPEPIYFLYGKIVHKIIELYSKSKGKENISEISKKVMNGEVEINEGQVAHHTELPLDYKMKLPVHLRHFLNLYNKIGSAEQEFIEYPFLFDLNPPEQKFLKGVIDRLIIKNNQYFVIDYKTTKKGKFRKDITNITSDLQLQCYARVIMREFNVDPDNIKTALYYLEDGELVAAKFSEKTLLAVEEKLLNTYKEIELKEPESAIGRTGIHCNNCVYRSRCPFFGKRGIIKPYPKK